MPELSIITINLNNTAGLQKTFASVFDQSFKDFEYIVIDGGSSDGGKEIIENNSAKLSYWVSEKDKGVYNAMNKGIVKAKGEYLLFLNSGDYLAGKEVLEELMTLTDNKDIVYGDVLIDREENPFIKVVPDTLVFSFFITDALPHQGVFFKKRLFTDLGLYNESLQIVADWEFSMNAICRFHASYKHAPVLVTVFNTEGICSREENYPLMDQEKREVLAKHYPAFLSDYEAMKANSGNLKIIHNSRFWKLRNYLSGLPVYKFIQKRSVKNG